MRRHVVFGLPLDAVTQETLFDFVFQKVEERRKTLVSHINVHAVNLARKDPEFRRSLCQADLIYCDGMGLKWAANLTGRRIPERMTAVDWLDDFAARLGDRGLFFLGSGPGVIEKARTQLPRCRFDGHHGFFHKTGPENEQVLRKIREASPSVLMVGMGMPLQEKWVQDNWQALPDCVIMTVGGLLEVYTGQIRRVPRWLSDHGGEWIGRLFWQFRHVWKRYLIGNPLFLGRVILSVIHPSRSSIGALRPADKEHAAVATPVLRHPKKRFLGLRLDPVTPSRLYRFVTKTCHAGRKALVTHLNVHAVNLAHENPTFRAVLNRSSLTYCDGFGVKIAANLLGVRTPKRMTAPDWLDEFVKVLRDHDLRLFFVGSRPPVLETGLQKLRAAAPGLRVEGHPGHFEMQGEENQRAVEAIRRFAPNVLLVGMGMPRQELWVGENWERLDANVVMTVGAAMEFYTGAWYRPPRWITDAGGEWIGRLILQPHHVWKRYVFGNPLYLARVILSLVR